MTRSGRVRRRREVERDEHRLETRLKLRDFRREIVKGRPGRQLRQQRLDRVRRRRAVGEPDARQHPQRRDGDTGGGEKQPGFTRSRRVKTSTFGTVAFMSFCEHCEGQRFDRARILRVLRESRQRLRRSETTCSADHALASVIEAVRTLDIPHLDREDEVVDGEVVH